MTTITLNTDSLFKDILAAFDEMNSETPNQFLVDLGRHQTIVLREMARQLQYLMAEQGKEVKKLEEQNEKMLRVLKIYAEGSHEIGTYYAENVLAEIEGENQ
jgi:hypothetical protein